MKDKRSGSRRHSKDLKERFQKVGIHGLLDYEVLELLLQYARPGEDIKPLAEGLIGRFGSFQRVLDEPVENLVSFPGMDLNTALLLKVTKNCSDYYLKQKVLGKHTIKCGLDLIKYCRTTMTGLSEEHFRVVFLNTQSEVIDIETIHEGTIDQSVVYPRKVIERALYHKASALIFVHNHTGGKAIPSYADREITNTLVTAACSMDMEVHDHIIIARDGFFSFRDAGLLKGTDDDCGLYLDSAAKKVAAHTKAGRRNHLKPLLPLSA